MHEMSLAEGVLQLVEETARREHASRIKRVVLEIGQLASVEPEALKFCFSAVTHGSMAQTAWLEIIPVAGAAWCQDCARTVPITVLYDLCPVCGSPQLQATHGTEMRVKEIEIE